MKTLLRRALWAAGTAAAFVLLALLGSALGSLLSSGEPARLEPEPVRTGSPPPTPAPEPSPRPRPPPPARAVAPSTDPGPRAAPEAPLPAVRTNALTLPARLEVRRELIEAISGLKDELARCPAEAVQRSPPGSRAAVVLDAVGEGESVRVLETTLEAEVPVNDRFVSCARAALQGRTFAAPGAAAGARLRFSIPLGPGGNSLSLRSASLSESDAPGPGR